MTHDISFAASPAIRWFGHRIPPDGLISATDARIYYNHIAPWRVRDVAVIYYPQAASWLAPDAPSPMDDEAHPVRLRMNAIDLLFDGVTGNGWRHWMQDLADLPRAKQWDPELAHHTPDTVWRMFLEIGFLDEAQARRALAEFARIRECEWARNPGYKLPAVRPLTDEEKAQLQPGPFYRRIETVEPTGRTVADLGLNDVEDVREEDLV